MKKEIILLDIFIKDIKKFQLKINPSIFSLSSLKLCCFSSDGCNYISKYNEEATNPLTGISSYSLITIIVAFVKPSNEINEIINFSIVDCHDNSAEIQAKIILNYSVNENFQIPIISKNFHGSLSYESHLLHGKSFHLSTVIVSNKNGLQPLPIPKNGRPTLFIGHRGMGAETYGFSPNYKKWPENTIASFLRAAEVNLDMIELDVQLTLDKQSIIHHEFRVTSLNQSENTHSHPIVVTHDGQVAHQIVNRLFRDVSMTDLLSYSQTHQQEKTKMNENEHYVTLSDVLRLLPTSIGLNIEFKYPIYQENGCWNNGVKGKLPKEYYMNMVEFVETILEQIFAAATISPERSIVFSCFHPHICLLLREKQSIYPVFYITRGPTPEEDYNGIRFVDPRCTSVQAAIYWCEFINCQGVVTAAHQLPNDLTILTMCRERNLSICVYNKPGSTTDYLAFAKKEKITGLIIDDVEATLENFAKKMNEF